MKNKKASNWFFFIMYFLNPLRFGFVAVLLGIGAFFAYSYWQELTRGSNDLHVQASNSEYSIDLFYPDKISANQESNVEIVVDALTPLEETEKVTVEFKINDDEEYSYFDPKVKIITIDNSTRTSGRVLVKMGYRNPLIPSSQPVGFDATLKTSDGDLLLRGNVRVDSTSKKVLTIVATLSMALGALGAILQIGVQLKEFLSKKS